MPLPTLCGPGPPAAAAAAATAASASAATSMGMTSHCSANDGSSASRQDGSSQDFIDFSLAAAAAAPAPAVAAVRLADEKGKNFNNSKCHQHGSHYADGALAWPMTAAGSSRKMRDNCCYLKGIIDRACRVATVSLATALNAPATGGDNDGRDAAGQVAVQRTPLQAHRSHSSGGGGGSGGAKCLLMCLLFFVVLLAQLPRPAAAEKSKHYYMQSLCKNHFLQQIYRKIDGAVLWSQNERNLNCVITFQTHSILQRFMLRFDMLQLDCNDHLYVYDGAHAVANPKIDISCRQTKQTVSSILTRTNFVTLKYVTDGWGTDANGFKLVITSVKDPKHACKDFTCGTREFCIHRDLLCDGINHCGDNSDESVHNLCQNETTNTIFGVDMTWFVLIVVSCLLILSAIIVGISICVCRQQDEAAHNQNTAMQLHHTTAIETNGSSKHLQHHYLHHQQQQHHLMLGGGGGHHGTLPREHTQLPPTSGNWHHPAGPYGYRIPRNLLKMAIKVRPIWCLANSVN